MKKKIFWIFLCVLMIIPTFALFGCNKNASSNEVYSTLQTTIESFDYLDSPFVKQNIGLSPGYNFKDFKTKDSSGVLNVTDDDENYQFLNVAAIKYIKNCSEILHSMEKKNISYLDSTVKEFAKSYNELKEKHTKLANFATWDYNIWNGAFAQYKLSAKNFIEKEYDLALKLGDYLINKAKIAQNFVSEEKTADDIKNFTDYQTIKLCNDLYQFFIISCKGQKEATSAGIAENSRLKSIWNNLISKDNESISKEVAQEFVNISKMMDNQRKIYEKAINKFSFFDFVTKYNLDINSYSKKLKNAKIYENAIDKYESSSTNYTKEYYDWIVSNIKVS